jgi:hypothetical protein
MGKHRSAIVHPTRVVKTTAKTQIDHTLPVLLLPKDTAIADLS